MGLERLELGAMSSLSKGFVEFAGSITERVGAAISGAAERTVETVAANVAERGGAKAIASDVASDAVSRAKAGAGVAKDVASKAAEGAKARLFTRVEGQSLGDFAKKAGLEGAQILEVEGSEVIVDASGKAVSDAGALSKMTGDISGFINGTEGVAASEVGETWAHFAEVASKQAEAYATGSTPAIQAFETTAALGQSPMARLVGAYSSAMSEKGGLTSAADTLKATGRGLVEVVTGKASVGNASLAAERKAMEFGTDSLKRPAGLFNGTKTVEYTGKAMKGLKMAVAPGIGLVGLSAAVGGATGTVDGIVGAVSGAGSFLEDPLGTIGKLVLENPNLMMIGGGALAAFVGGDSVLGMVGRIAAVIGVVDTIYSLANDGKHLTDAIGDLMNGLAGEQIFDTGSDGNSKGESEDEPAVVTSDGADDGDDDDYEASEGGSFSFA